MTEHPIGDMMAGAMDKIHTMVDSNTMVGEPIVTPDGITLIPVSRISFGFASGGNDGTAANKKAGVWAGSGAGVKVEPIGFLKLQHDSARMIGIQMPALSTVDRVIDMVPDVLDRIEGYAEKFSRKRQNG